MAKQELAQSGYPHGFKGSLLEYDTVTSQVAEVIASELQKIGIDLQVNQVTDATWLANESGPDAKRAASFTNGGCSGPDVSRYDFYLGSVGLKLGNYNEAAWAPPSIDQLLAAGLATSVPAKRFAIYSDIVRTMASDEPYVPLFLQDAIIALSKNFVAPQFNAWFVWGDYALGIKPAT